MTDAYVTHITPTSISLGVHFGFWATNGPKWQPKNAKMMCWQFQLIMLTFQLIIGSVLKELGSH